MEANMENGELRKASQSPPYQLRDLGGEEHRVASYRGGQGKESGVPGWTQAEVR